MLVVSIRRMALDYLLRALNRLQNDLQRHDFYCVIIGDGDSLPDLRCLASQLRLNGCIEFTGFIPDRELLENLAAADICVDPDPSSPLNNVVHLDQSHGVHGAP